MRNVPIFHLRTAARCLRLFVLLYAIVCVSLIASAQTGTSNWVRIGTNGKLQYTPDAKGNIIPDFSLVGYQFGNEAIPTVPVVRTLNAVSGDNLSQIQNAINEVAALTPDANGFRGAILLKKGAFNVSNTLTINASGIVLRGEGTGTADTRLIATRTAQHTLIDVIGGGSPAEVSGSRKKITNSYVAVGARTFTVEAAAGFAVGDEIILRIEPKASWITLLDMAQYGWTPEAYRMSYVRVITAIQGNTVTIDAPVVDPIDVTYKDAYIYKYTWNKIEKVGIENIRFQSVYTGTEDENHGWTAISIDRARHCWVRNSHFYYFGYSAVFVKEWGVNVSVLNCQNRDPISVTTGGRKYSFNLNGQLALFKDCYTHSGRHDYVTGSTTAGPNAFVSCRAENQRADIGPHHRWSTGLLFDNVIGSGDQNVQNRQESGSGHGWAGAQTVFWNCTSPKFIVQKPPQHFNWAIGCKGTVTDNGNWHDGDPGIWESTGNFVPPQSLYDKQLSDRLSGTPPPTCEPATASGDDGNVAANVLDNNLATRWSASGDGQWIQFCLSDTFSITGVQIAFYSGNTRTSTFDVLVGNDGVNWTTASAGRVSSGTSLNLETFTFTPVAGKYVRIVGHGNSVNAWNSYTEVEIQTGSGGSQTYTLTPEQDAYVRDGTNGAITHGTTDPNLLITKVSPTGQLNNAREAYLLFNLASVSGTVSSATLRVYGKVDLTTVPSVPIGIFPVANTTWTEATLTWNNKPASGTTALGTSTVNNTAYAYVTWDVTSYVQAELAASRTKVTFAMKSGVAHDPRVFWNSKETGNNPPQLVVEAGTSLAGRSPEESRTMNEDAVAKLKFGVYPNPVKTSSTITFHLEKAGHTNLSLYDISGKQVAVLMNGYLPAGDHRKTLTPGNAVTGVYVLKLLNEGKVVIKKIVRK